MLKTSFKNQYADGAILHHLRPIGWTALIKSQMYRIYDHIQPRRINRYRVNRYDFFKSSRFIQNFWNIWLGFSVISIILNRYDFLNRYGFCNDYLYVWFYILTPWFWTTLSFLTTYLIFWFRFLTEVLIISSKCLAEILMKITIQKKIFEPNLGCLNFDIMQGNQYFIYMYVKKTSFKMSIRMEVYSTTSAQESQ